MHLSPLRFDALRFLRPRRRGIASVNAEVRDGIVPAGDALARTSDLEGGTPASANYRTVALIIACAMFMENLDATVLATALPTMARDFGVRAPELSIALTAYLLALAMFIPASGAAADRFGAKQVFRAAIGLFLAGSLVCGLAPNLTILVIARFVQGIGGAMMLPVGRLVLLRSVAKRDMVSAMSWLIMPALIGPIIGPPIGGLIVTYFDWRWIFWLNLPIGIVGIFLVGRFIADIREPSVHRFDRIGFVLSAVALGCLLFGFEMSSRSGAGTLAAILIALGVASGALYLRHAARTEHPILDFSLMRIPTFRLSLLGGSLTRITQGAQPFLLPLMMQLGFGLSAAQSGAMTLATAIGSLGMKGVAPRLLRRFGFRSSLIWLGLLGAGSYALCGLFRPGWPLAAVFAVMLVSGFLMSFQFTAYNTIAYDEIAKDRMSVATSFYSTLQQLMLSLGICTGATALHVSMAIRGDAAPGFTDFSAAFWTVTAISLLSVFVNARFDRDAGAEISGRGYGSRGGLSNRESPAG
ncbi:DHA2 family efflux MFS transporter permease subunit [Sphingomonas lycopersici]|uniref:DHA2 family efflux MFS transporter permease subunit n=1 Tax=Sphingomonas lycopersici TaxID=2951807 RepID=A0AA41Z405_9SPHN|nr:DHA2 family efflux MFS transporter permease subunit [Sphingomonas lycopersici]MCW6533595.1 DHA2 family efflux MFS transporter permease subunit [Sphingomonas lycopersici]